MLQQQEQYDKVTAAVAAVEEKAEYNLQIEKERAKINMDKIRTASDEQKFKLIDQMKGMR